MAFKLRFCPSWKISREEGVLAGKPATPFPASVHHLFLDNPLPPRYSFLTAEVSDVTIMGLSEAIENESLILTCTSVGSEVSYYWFRGNQSLEDGGHISLGHDNQNLTINPVSRSDTGSYTCLGVNRISNNTSTPFELTVFCKCGTNSQFIPSITSSQLPSPLYVPPKN